MRAIRYVTAIAILLALSACGGGGDGAPQPPPVQHLGPDELGHRNLGLIF